MGFHAIPYMEPYDGSTRTFDVCLTVQVWIRILVSIYSSYFMAGFHWTNSSHNSCHSVRLLLWPFFSRPQTSHWKSTFYIISLGLPTLLESILGCLQRDTIVCKAFAVTRQLRKFPFPVFRHCETSFPKFLMSSKGPLIDYFTFLQSTGW